jgi:predicted nucleic acid-binding protein
MGFSGQIIATAWVLTELADALAPSPTRNVFLTVLRHLRADWRVEIIPADAVLFDAGCALNARRRDKDWSLTDCISFEVMRQRGLGEALTADHHFEQAGFTALLKS